MARNQRSRRIAAANAAQHKANVLAAAAADRHAKAFTAMFAIAAPAEALEMTAAQRRTYLADATSASRRGE